MPPFAPAVSQQTQRRFLLKPKTGLTAATPFTATGLFGALVAIGLVSQLMPRPNGWTLDHIHEEDEVISLSDFAHLGSASGFVPTSGYLHLLPHRLSFREATGTYAGRNTGAILGASLLAILLVSAVADFGGDKTNDAGPSWTATVQESRGLCTAGAHEVAVPFAPQGTPVVWTSTLPCGVFLRG